MVPKPMEAAPCCRMLLRKHASCAILVGQGHSEPTDVEGTCFRKRPRKHGAAEARIGRAPPGREGAGGGTMVCPRSPDGVRTL